MFNKKYKQENNENLQPIFNIIHRHHIFHIQKTAEVENF